MNPKIHPHHLCRKAVVYLRQSSMHQVRFHTESTRRQYDLSQRAQQLGWRPEDIEVIDEDLGVSGKSITRRHGFQRLAKDVSVGEVGAILALEVSRLARRSADWHHLLDLCRLTDVLIIDEQSVYAPQDYNDQLLLGLKGTMAEAERVWMRLRLEGGRLNKARRGEYRIAAPTGYQWDHATKRLRLDPDERVQSAIRLVFERFRIEGSSHGICRYFDQHGLQLPALRNGFRPICWGPARPSRILKILHSPIYTGTYVYGRRLTRTRIVNGEIRPGYLEEVSPEAWKVCIHDHHPAYLTWEEYMENKRRLAQNSNAARSIPHGAPRKGGGLLVGLVLCGCCGSRMSTLNNGRGDPRYACHAPRARLGKNYDCWSVSSRYIDKAVVASFLEVATPPQLALSLAVGTEVKRQADQLEKQWNLRRQQVRYQARLAERRYKSVDPENRVVARTLEREWEESLREVESVERGFQAACRRHALVVDEESRAQILSLSETLVPIWKAPSTTNAQRKQLLRTLIKVVTLHPEPGPPTMTRIEVLWKSDAVTTLRARRPRGGDANAAPPEIEEEIRERAMADESDVAIARALNAKGLLTGAKMPWTPNAVRVVRRRTGIRPLGSTVGGKLRRPNRREDGLYSIHGVAEFFGITRDMVAVWRRTGQLTPAAGGGPGRTCWYRLDEETIKRLNAVKGRPRGPRKKQKKNQGLADTEVV